MNPIKKFLTDPIYKKLAKRYPGLKLFREYSVKTFDRREILRKIMNFTAECKVGGDYLEFGVYKGSTFFEAVKMAGPKDLDSMRFYAFDSFQGLPEPKGVDAHSDQFYSGQVSNPLENFKKIMKKSGADESRISIIPGWFKDTLHAETKKKLGLKSVAVAWIDCDLYESTVPVLNFLTDLVVDGTVLVFDDWFFYKGHPDRGERKAFAEWLAKNQQWTATEYHKYSWHGNSFILNRKEE